jgi:hypothetical protein
VTRADPKADPIEDTGAGSEGAGDGGEAAWRRKLAPRHRDAVRRFFGGDGK